MMRPRSSGVYLICAPERLRSTPYHGTCSCKASPPSVPPSLPRDRAPDAIAARLGRSTDRSSRRTGPPSVAAPLHEPTRRLSLAPPLRFQAPFSPAELTAGPWRKRGTGFSFIPALTIRRPEHRNNSGNPLIPGRESPDSAAGERRASPGPSAVPTPCSRAWRSPEVGGATGGQANLSRDRGGFPAVGRLRVG